MVRERNAFRRLFSRIGAGATVLLVVMLASCSAVGESVSFPGPGPRATPSVPAGNPRAPYGTGFRGGPGFAVVSGHVTTADGQPVAGARIELRMASVMMKCPDCVPHALVETGPEGGYSTILQDGAYTAECDVAGPCGAEGTRGGRVAFTVPSVRILDFIVCDGSTDVPKCLSR